MIALQIVGGLLAAFSVILFVWIIRYRKRANKVLLAGIPKKEEAWLRFYEKVYFISFVFGILSLLMIAAHSDCFADIPSIDRYIGIMSVSVIVGVITISFPHSSTERVGGRCERSPDDDFE